MSPGTARLFRQTLKTKRLRLENEEQALAQAESELRRIRVDRDATAAEIDDLERLLRDEGLEP